MKGTLASYAGIEDNNIAVLEQSLIFDVQQRRQASETVEAPWLQKC